MDLQKLKEIILTNEIPKYRIKQIEKAIFQDGFNSFLDISNLPLNLRDILNSQLEILPFQVKKVLVSNDKKSIKAVLNLKDNFLIETVLEFHQNLMFGQLAFHLKLVVP